MTDTEPAIAQPSPNTVREQPFGYGCNVRPR